MPVKFTNIMPFFKKLYASLKLVLEKQAPMCASGVLANQIDPKKLVSEVLSYCFHKTQTLGRMTASKKSNKSE